MTIDGTNTKSWGMIPVNVQGAYSMPNRKSPYFYDWGDEIEVLLGPSWKAFDPRVILVDFVYDPRQQTIGVPGGNYVDTWTRGHMSAGEMVLMQSDAEGTMGQATVQLETITGHRRYRGGIERFTAQFRERVPAFNGALPGVKSGGAISLDGYGLSQFQASLMRVRGLSDLGGAKESPETTYLEAQKLSTYRGLQSISLDLVIRSNTPMTRLGSLQQVLIGEQVLPFTYSGLTFNTFMGPGFQVQKLDAKTLKFELKLFRL